MKIEFTPALLKNRLELGEVKFQYIKKDGSLRKTNGTTKLELISEDQHPKGGAKDTKGIPYFDIEIKQWRSISEDALIDVDLDSLLELPGMPTITQEELEFMVWYEGLSDPNGWMTKFITLIWEATPQDASELLNGRFKNLIRVIKKHQDDEDYKNELGERWYKLTR